MSYQVLARKWRPRTFAELAGQEHVARALINALDHDRLHHAFLFTGTRGVGKTTIARILARALNCERGVSSTPCGECDACREIDEGRFVDLIEVDAASRTRVEDTRELLENVQYAPTRGRYKVYLVDEVHMLSTHSFNALLKTLEEPPPHVKFLLATTDPQRLPATVLSRCLQFHLKRLPPALIVGHLSMILGREGVDTEPGAVEPIARAAEGSMRDALSLLDQAIAYGGGTLRTDDVRTMLGTLPRERLVGLVEALAAGDGAGLLGQVEELAEQCADFPSVLAELLVLLHRVALIRQVPGAIEEDDRDAVAALAERLAPEDVQLFYQIALLGRRDLPLAPDPRAGFEMVLLRMLAFRPEDAPVVPVSNPAPAAKRRPRAAAPKTPPAPAREDPVPTPAGSAPAARGTAPAAGPEASPEAAPAQEEWLEMVRDSLGLGGPARELAANCNLLGREGETVQLLLDGSRAHLRSPSTEERLLQSLQRHFGTPVRLAIRLGKPVVETPSQRWAREDRDRVKAATRAIKEDRTVQALCETFDGEIAPGSVRPTD
ncbi:DNA polymerase III subunit tau [bacterium BMS3Bbin12]|nr:DNA polymerase III subunit tau [bacterium BMS3Abin12]GBE48615.1 DNA polymerase III subunit tau [bacterium BMS3Bbin12]GBE51420.1 DNA polymerase III subunit tau [bacterium BMS3Bbin13]HDJ86075.1 DNA polymerase III subunit gamma/tau [Chromatiales bacterium]